MFVFTFIFMVVVWFYRRRYLRAYGKAGGVKVFWAYNVIYYFFMVILGLSVLIQFLNFLMGV